MKTKTCTKCKIKKRAVDFSKDSRRKDGVRSWCRDCCKRRQDEYYSNPDNRKFRVKQVLASRKRHKEKYKIMQRKWRLKNYYNLTIAEHDEMFRSQKGLCAICGNSLEQTKSAVDHNHKNGLVRGLLCINCNTKLGWYEKQKENIQYYLGE